MSTSPAVFFLKALLSLPFVSVCIKPTDIDQDEKFNAGFTALARPKRRRRHRPRRKRSWKYQ